MNTYELQNIVKGFANHRRIQIMDLLDKKPGLSLTDISETLGINFKTASEHVKRLELSGLVSKRYKGRKVIHELTGLGKKILTFLRMLE